MQTTGLFSSSSPQQANVGGGSSLIGTLGAALVLVFGVVLLTGLSLDRTQTAMVRFLAEKGVALVTALESGVRSGTRSRTGIRLQYLVEELADRPDVRFIAVTMPDGTILAHSNPARVGEVLNTRGGRELGAETIAALRPSETPSWAIIDMEGSRAFVVFKTFHPKVKGEGRQDEPMVGPLPYVFLGLDLAPLEVAQAQNRERAVLLGAGCCWPACWPCLAARRGAGPSSRRGQRVAEALAEELAVALPDGLVVFDAKGPDHPDEQGGADPARHGSPGEGQGLPGAGNRRKCSLRRWRNWRRSCCRSRCCRIRKSSCGTERNSNTFRYAAGTSMKGMKAASVRSCSCVTSRKSAALRRKSAAGKSLPPWATSLRASPMSCAIRSAPSRGMRRISAGGSLKAARIGRRRKSWSKEVERLNRAIGDLIGLSRPTDIRPRMTGMRRLIEDTLRLIGQDAANHKVAIRFDAPEVLPDVAIDPDRMRQVILNLCLNGLEAMPDGGELFLSLHPEPDALRLEIRDTGMGIAPDALPHIFDPYFTTKGQGTGSALPRCTRSWKPTAGAFPSLPSRGRAPYSACSCLWAERAGRFTGMNERTRKPVEKKGGHRVDFRFLPFLQWFLRKGLTIGAA